MSSISVSSSKLLHAEGINPRKNAIIECGAPLAEGAKNIATQRFQNNLIKIQLYFNNHWDELISVYGTEVPTPNGMGITLTSDTKERLRLLVNASFQMIIDHGNLFITDLNAHIPLAEDNNGFENARDFISTLFQRITNSFAELTTSVKTMVGLNVDDAARSFLAAHIYFLQNNWNRLPSQKDYATDGSRVLLYDASSTYPFQLPETLVMMATTMTKGTKVSHLEPKEIYNNPELFEPTEMIQRGVANALSKMWTKTKDKYDPRNKLK